LVERWEWRLIEGNEGRMSSDTDGGSSADSDLLLPPQQQKTIYNILDSFFN